VVCNRPPGHEVCGAPTRTRFEGVSGPVFDRIALVPQEADDLLAVVPLELDATVLRRPARGDEPLQLLRERVDVRVVREALDDGDRLPVPARVNPDLQGSRFPGEFLTDTDFLGEATNLANARRRLRRLRRDCGLLPQHLVVLTQGDFAYPRDPRHVRLLKLLAQGLACEVQRASGGAEGAAHSGEFAGKPVQSRHRMVYDALGSMMAGEIHALAIKAYAPGEI